MALPGRRLAVPLAVALGLGGVTFIAMQSVGDLEPYVHVDELARHPEKYIGKGVLQVRGYARNVPEHATVVQQQAVREFDLEKAGLSVHVRHQGSVPDTFKEQSATVVRGTVRMQDGRPIIDTVGGDKGVVAKCPSKYEAPPSP